MPDAKLIARGYHGTTLAAATRIVDSKEFLQESHPWHWLGQGIYFWQDAPLRAWEWAEHRAAEDHKTTGLPSEPAVVSATIDLSACLDLLDIAYWAHVEKAWRLVEAHYGGLGASPPTQIGPGEVFWRKRVERHWLVRHFSSLLGFSRKVRYGNNRRDYDVMNATIQLLADSGAPVTTARAAFMEGDELYDGSWLLDRSHVQIAIVDPDAIRSVLSDVTIEPSDELKRKYDEVVRAYQTTWSRRMKSAN